MKTIMMLLMCSVFLSGVAVAAEHPSAEYLSEDVIVEETDDTDAVLAETEMAQTNMQQAMRSSGIAKRLP